MSARARYRPLAHCGVAPVSGVLRPHLPVTTASATRHEPAETGGQIVLDLESLVLDPAPAVAHSLAFTIRSLGLLVPPQDLLERGAGQPIAARLSRWIRQPEQLRQALQLYHEHYHAEGCFKARPREGAAALLACLAELGAWPVHYLTHIGHSAALRLMRGLDATAAVTSIISCKRAGSGLMRPHLLSGLLQQGEVPAQRTLLISDHPLELAAAAELGVHTLALAYGRAPAALLLQYRPLALALNCDEVASLLRTYCLTSARSSVH